MPELGGAALDFTVRASDSDSGLSALSRGPSWAERGPAPSRRAVAYITVTFCTLQNERSHSHA